MAVGRGVARRLHREQQDGKCRTVEHPSHHAGPLRRGALGPAEDDQVHVLVGRHPGNLFDDGARPELDTVRMGKVPAEKLPPQDVHVVLGPVQHGRSSMAGTVASVNTWRTTSSTWSTSRGSNCLLYTS